MASELLNQTLFGVYEIIANIIPGTMVLVTIIFLTCLITPFPSINAIPESILAVFLVFLAFAIGFIIQAISSYIEKYLKITYPSTYYLNDSDTTFPKYFKVKIREIVSKKFGVPSDLTSQQIYDLCYTHIMRSKKSSARVSQFLRNYTFARNMFVTMIIEAFFSIYFTWQLQSPFFGLLALALFSLAYIFHKRSFRFSQAFAKEVFLSFFVEEASKLQIQPTILPMTMK